MLTNPTTIRWCCPQPTEGSTSSYTKSARILALSWRARRSIAPCWKVSHPAWAVNRPCRVYAERSVPALRVGLG